MKYKVGDKVRVKEKEKIHRNYREREDLEDYFGKTLTISHVFYTSIISSSPFYNAEETGGRRWYSDMIDPIKQKTDAEVMRDIINGRNSKPYTPPNTGDPWIDNLPESYFEMYEEAETDKYTRHKEITDFMHKTYVSKNEDYGNSFERTHKEIGSKASLGRIADKFYRLQNIILNDEQHVEDETVKDTLIDMANYAIMFAMELEEEE